MAPEGRVLALVHRSYERSRKNRVKKLVRFKLDNAGRVFCESCGFDFEQTYGQRGAGFIECHHVETGIPVDCRNETPALGVPACVRQLPPHDSPGATVALLGGTDDAGCATTVNDECPDCNRDQKGVVR